MSNDFFSQVLDMSRQVAAQLVGQLEDARQKKLHELTKERDGLARQRQQIESQLSELQRQHAQLSAEIERFNGEIQTVENYDVRTGILNPAPTAAPAPVPEPTPEPTPAPAPSQPAKSSNGQAKEAPAKPTPAAKKPATPAAPATAPKPIRAYVVEVLQEEGGFMTQQEIADAILAKGYPTKSRDFAASIKSLLIEMKLKKLIKHDPKKGYSA